MPPNRQLMLTTNRTREIKSESRIEAFPWKASACLWWRPGALLSLCTTTTTNVQLISPSKTLSKLRVSVAWGECAQVCALENVCALACVGMSTPGASPYLWEAQDWRYQPLCTCSQELIGLSWGFKGAAVKGFCVSWTCGLLHSTLFCILGGFGGRNQSGHTYWGAARGYYLATDGVIPASKSAKGSRNWMLRSQKETTWGSTYMLGENIKGY